MIFKLPIPHHFPIEKTLKLNDLHREIYEVLKSHNVFSDFIDVSTDSRDNVCNWHLSSMKNVKKTDKFYVLASSSSNKERTEIYVRIVKKILHSKVLLQH
jgi:hypothetical protein